MPRSCQQRHSSDRCGPDPSGGRPRRLHLYTGRCRVKFALSLGVLNPTAWVAVTEEADRLGYDSVWIPEHLVLPVEMGGSPHDGQDHPPIPSEIPVFDALVYLSHPGRAYRAHPVRHPGLQHRPAPPLQHGTGRGHARRAVRWPGRLRHRCQLAAGRVGRGGPRLRHPRRAGRRVPSTSAAGSGRNRSSSTTARFFDFAPVRFEPKPVQQPWPRLHIGGDGPAALRRAATVGDGWVPMNHTLEQIPAAVVRLAELRDRAGRPGRTEVTLGGADQLQGRRRALRRGRGRSGVRQAVEPHLGCTRRDPPLRRGVPARLTRPAPADQAAVDPTGSGVGGEPGSRVRARHPPLVWGRGEHDGGFTTRRRRVQCQVMTCPHRPVPDPRVRLPPAPDRSRDRGLRPRPRPRRSRTRSPASSSGWAWRTHPTDSTLRLSLLTHALKRGVWLLGFAIMVGSFLFQAVALHLGNLSQVQPILTTELLLLVLLLATWFRYRIGGIRLARRAWQPPAGWPDSSSSPSPRVAT